VRADPATMPRVGTVGERLQSYNVEMAEVIGGTFWKPYGKDTAAIPGHQQATTPTATPVGLDPALFERRPPVNLSDSRFAQARGGAGTGLCAGQRNLGECRVPPRLAWPSSLIRPGGLQRRADGPAMGQRRRVRRGRGCGTGHIVCHRQRNPRREGDVDPGSGPALSRMHGVGWRQDRRCRIHERANLRRDGRRAERLRRSGVWARHRRLPAFPEAGRSQHDLSRPRFSRGARTIRVARPHAALRGSPGGRRPGVRRLLLPLLRSGLPTVRRSGPGCGDHG
jgi:hypothetical protein